MERVVLRHLSGSKANQIEEFPVSGTKTLLFGRDPSANVRYDPDRDDLVGRQHARLVQDSTDCYKFTLEDLNSRNGTYVNSQRLLRTMALSPGDVIQFGPGGPEVQFDLDPLPPHLVRTTRLAASQPMVPPTRAADVVPAPPAPAMRASTTVGKQTVERMVSQARVEGRRTIMMTVAAVLVVVAVLAGYFGWRMTRQPGEIINDINKNRPWTPAQIAGAYTESTVWFEVAWKLVDVQTGSQVFHEYVVETDERGRPAVDEDGQPKEPIPVYWRLRDGSIEPSLVKDRGKYGQNQPIGGEHTGSGFVVANDGFILTNRHVAATWETSYVGFPRTPGLLKVEGSDEAPQLTNRIPTKWVPAAAKLLGGRQFSGKGVEGRLDYMDVTFAKNRLRAPARLVRASDRHDVAMVKVDIPQPLTTVPLNDNYDTIQTGASITVLGYPAASPEVRVKSISQDVFNPGARFRAVPDPTVSPGTVTRVIRGDAPSGKELPEYWSTSGDTYQLDTTTTGGGNSGGPVFDDHGKVIGVLTAGLAQSGAIFSFATPIRYGIELMGTATVIK